MMSSLKLVFADVLRKLAIFDLENIRVHIICPDVRNNRALPAAEAIERVNIGNNTTRINYNVFPLMESHVKLGQDFDSFLNRDFVASISDAFDLEKKGDDATQQIAYVASLFKHFVHDGEYQPDLIDEVEIKNIPNHEIQSEDVIKNYKDEVNLYVDPTRFFLKEYDNWKLLGKKVFLNGFERHLVVKKKISLGEALRAQFAAPLLRHLIKLRIIHLCLLLSEKHSLKSNSFFKNENLETVLEKLQNTTQEAIQELLTMPHSKRKELAKKERDENPEDLRPIIRRLTQHIPALRLLTGHVFYDIHQNYNKNSTFIFKAVLYIGSHANANVIIYMLSRIYKSFKKSFLSLRKFIKGEESANSLFGGFFNLIKSLYAAIWAPFIASYLVVTGLTSLPFSLLRKVFSVSLGGKADERVSILEAIKDSILVIIAAPYAYTLFTSVSEYLLGSVGLSVGGTAFLGASLIILAPFLTPLVQDYYQFTPGLYQINGQMMYVKESTITSLVDGLKALGANALIALHSFVLVCALASYIGIAAIGRLLNTLKSLCENKEKECTKNEVFAHNQNLNHAPEFKKRLGEVFVKLDEGTCDKNDHLFLAGLQQAQFNPNKKTLLENYLRGQAKKGAIQPEEQSIYNMALIQMKKEKVPFLPSWKLINRLHDDLHKASGANKDLVAEIERIHQVYTSRMPGFAG